MGVPLGPDWHRRLASFFFSIMALFRPCLDSKVFFDFETITLLFLFKKKYLMIE